MNQQLVALPRKHAILAQERVAFARQHIAFARVAAIAVVLLAATFAGCGTEGAGGLAKFTVGDGWDQDTTVPIALGSVFNGTARENDIFAKPLRLESSDETLLAPSLTETGMFEAVGVGTVQLVAKTEAGTRMDSMEFRIVTPTKIDVAHWTDLSLDPTSRMGDSIGAVGGSSISLKMLVTDVSGTVLRHKGIASLISNSGHPVNVDTTIQEPTLTIGASGAGKFSAKLTFSAGAPVVHAYDVAVIGESDVGSIEIASGPVTVGLNGEASGGEAEDTSISKMHLMFARCQDAGAARVYGCTPVWTKVEGDTNLLLPTTKASEFNWAELGPGQSISVKATLGGLNSVKKITFGD